MGTKKLDMKDIIGQEHIKRAVEVAVSGGHSVVFVGVPDSGKTMIRTRLKTITPLAISPIPTFEMRPCPCGHFTDYQHKCNCTPKQIQKHIIKYTQKLNLSCCDISLEVARLKLNSIPQNTRIGETSATIKARAERAYLIQLERQRKPNSALQTSVEIEKYCVLHTEAEELFKLAILEIGISARAYDRILKVARTIADLEQSDIIQAHHLSEAISYRSLDRLLWN